MKHFIFFHYGFSLCIYCCHVQLSFLCFLHYNLLETSPMSPTSYIAKNNTWDLSYVWRCCLTRCEFSFWGKVMDVTCWDYMKEKETVYLWYSECETWNIFLGCNHFLKETEPGQPINFYVTNAWDEWSHILRTDSENFFVPLTRVCSLPLSSWAPCVHMWSHATRLLLYHVGPADTFSLPAMRKGLRNSVFVFIYLVNMRQGPARCQVQRPQKHSDCYCLWGGFWRLGCPPAPHGPQTSLIHNFAEACLRLENSNPPTQIRSI